MTKLTAKALGTTVYAPAYTYDPSGRVATKKEKSTTFGYTYDASGRLIGTTKNGAVDATYSYDANGNRTDSGVVVDAQDRMTAGFGATYTYTANGELATVTSGANVTSYGYDGRGQLVSAALPAGRGTVTYGLDALGRRVTRSLNGAITNRFVYRNALEIAAEVSSTGTVTTRYVHGPLSHTPAYFIRGGATYAVLTDHLGSVRSVVRTSDGTVMQSLTYDPWGKVLTDSSPGFQPFGFAGGLYDKDTGLVHFGAREYDGSTGRWTTKDPSRFEGGVNLYAYSFDDPVNWVDLTGNAPCPAGSHLRPDYKFGSVTIAPPGIGPAVGAQLSVDRYNNIYFGLGFGAVYGGPSFSRGAGWLDPLSPCPPSEAELVDYMTGWSSNPSVGYTSPYFVGGAVGESVSSPSKVTGVEASGTLGMPGPSWSFLGQYTWELGTKWPSWLSIW
jgi:RHS repeat-associated protein